MFSVIEHLTFSTAQEIIGPECNTASEAPKTVLPSLPLCLLFSSFTFLHSKTSLRRTCPFLFCIQHFSLLLSQHNDSLTYNVVVKLSGLRAVSVCLTQLSISFTSLIILIHLPFVNLQRDGKLITGSSTV